MFQFYLIYFLLIQLFYYISFSFLVIFNDNLLILIPNVNIKVKEEPIILACIFTIEACEAIHNVPNDVERAINILSK